MPCAVPHILAIDGRRRPYATARMGASIKASYRAGGLDPMDHHAVILDCVEAIGRAIVASGQDTLSRDRLVGTVADVLQSMAPPAVAIHWMGQHTRQQLADGHGDPVWSYPAVPGSLRKRAGAHRSDWIRMIQAIADDADGSVDVEPIVRRCREDSQAHHRDANGWRDRLLDFIHAALPDDPRVSRLRVAFERLLRRAAALGQDWMGYRGALPMTRPWPDDTTLTTLWRAALAEHLIQTAGCQRDEAVRVAGWCGMDDDRGIELAGILALMDQHATRRLAGGMNEPVSWTLIRTAWMAGGAEDGEALYRAMIRQAVLPGGSAFRGDRHDDQYLRVEDTFESIQHALYQAVVDTRWNGTCTLDWTRVRAKGTMVAGLRPAAGVEAFVQVLDANLAAQGRHPYGMNGAISCNIPLQHPDAATLVSHAGSRHWRGTLLVPHAFMIQLMEHDTTPVDRGPADGASGARRMTAARLWNIAISAVERGWSLAFLDASRFSEPGADTVRGLDGYGCFAMPEPAALGWRSLAVHAGAWMGSDDVLDPQAIQNTARIVARWHAAMQPEPLVIGYVGWNDILPHEDPGGFMHRAMRQWHHALEHLGVVRISWQPANEHVAAARRARGGALAPEAINGMDRTLPLPTFLSRQAASCLAPFVFHASVLGGDDGLMAAPERRGCTFVEFGPHGIPVHGNLQQADAARGWTTLRVGLDFDRRLAAAAAARWWCPHGVGVLADASDPTGLDHQIRRAWLAGIDVVHGTPKGGQNAESLYAPPSTTTGAD